MCYNINAQQTLIQPHQAVLRAANMPGIRILLVLRKYKDSQFFLKTFPIPLTEKSFEYTIYNRLIRNSRSAAERYKTEVFAAECFCMDRSV